jgi:hypothetical protein
MVVGLVIGFLVLAAMAVLAYFIVWRSADSTSAVGMDYQYETEAEVVGNEVSTLEGDVDYTLDPDFDDPMLDVALSDGSAEAFGFNPEECFSSRF